MNETKIEWCDMTWNPVTGCLHGCEYCYARGIANRFGANGSAHKESIIRDGQLVVLDTQFIENKKICQYPFGFAPTFHRYRLDEPRRVKKPQNIFVCSMADLFGEWVPEEWILQVFEACKKAPWHKYLFLTKNPKRYEKLNLPQGENFWYGFSESKPNETDVFRVNCNYNVFGSLEPLQSKYTSDELDLCINWLIVGVETGNRKEKILPKKEWIDIIVEFCKTNEIPLFMKNSLASVWGEPLIQEFPDGLKE